MYDIMANVKLSEVDAIIWREMWQDTQQQQPPTHTLPLV